MPGLDDASQCGCRKFRQQDHTAVGMYEELHPVPRLESEVLANSFRDRSLPLYGDCGFHRCLHYIYINVIPRDISMRQGSAIKATNGRACDASEKFARALEIPMRWEQASRASKSSEEKNSGRHCLGQYRQGRSLSGEVSATLGQDNGEGQKPAAFNSSENRSKKDYSVSQRNRVLARTPKHDWAQRPHCLRAAAAARASHRFCRS
jgi:hypothetical protein